MVIFGGRSGEHDVSLASARAITDALEKSGRYEVVPVGITREGRWISSGDPMRELESASKALDSANGSESPISDSPASISEKLPANLGSVDVVFPVLHGPYGEDGTIQGMLELAGVPYVGSGVLASAASMDKITMKKIFAHHGLPQVEWLGLTRTNWERDSKSILRQIEDSIGYPCFVKPANLGSSVGISRATDAGSLRNALDVAAEHDRRIIVEAGVDAREIEVSVLGNEDPEVSVPGEVLVTANEFYDYEAKYTEGGSKIVAPADIPDEIASEMRRVARIAYESVDAAGMSRVDFFLERGTDRLLLNEINTIPGFTPTSVYAYLWDASGLPYEQLLDRLIQLALERHG
ncbi:MAG TPA: D-alanine--D-alanine ligase family protein [Rubrobacteraceae bacterium]|nr:D-alanine--D-alanine ligase family protein [Rubrobacteraceae bacterium]